MEEIVISSTIEKTITYRLIATLVRIWQKTKDFRAVYLNNSCRFHPSCSEYFLEAIKKQGFISGTYMSVKRLCKCNPLFQGGIDLVPENTSFVGGKAKS